MMRKAITGATLSALFLIAGGASAADPVCGDVNSSSSVTSSDALLVLKKAVQQPITLDCSAYDDQFLACETSVNACNAGTAAVGDVLAGKSFSSSAGLGVVGTMPNIGTATLLPSTTDQAIAAGYHNGAGKCAGDAELLSANILHGVNLFGVAGELPRAQVLKTGATVGSGPSDDGSVQAGAPRSFTDNGDGTITDNTTGLMWEKKDDFGGLHDQDNTYTWTSVRCTGLADGTLFTISSRSQRRRRIRRLYRLADPEPLRARVSLQHGGSGATLHASQDPSRVLVELRTGVHGHLMQLHVDPWDLDEHRPDQRSLLVVPRGFRLDVDDDGLEGRASCRAGGAGRLVGRWPALEHALAVH